MDTVSQRNDRPDRFLNLIDGVPCEADSGEWLDSIDPAYGRVWAQIPASGAPDIDRAVEAAERAFRRGSTWR